MTNSLLAATDLRARYGSVEALRGVSLEVPAGTIIAVIGPNGAGKSTLLAALMGLQPLTAGVVTWRGAPAPWAAADRVDAGLCLVPESREVFAPLSVLDNLMLGAWTRLDFGGLGTADALASVLERFPRLRERQHESADRLSSGEREMLAIGRALMAKPKVLMLDEPSRGLAPLVVRQIFRLIVELRQAGVAILLAEQDARAALAVADYAYVMQTGEVMLQGSAADLAAHAGLGSLASRP
jgi:branched-chain amino acid transport system ATP-binding protein